jgi:beta-glucanase (GH16 family)
MKLFFVSNFLFLQIGVSLSQCDWINVMLTEDVNCLSGNWTIAFEDNFDQNEIDQTKWLLPYQGVIRDYGFVNEKQWYANTGSTPSLPLSNNVKVSNGTLKLITRNENVTGFYVDDWSQSPPSTASSTFNYTSGQIESKYKFGYGLYEIRCKIPKGKGFWPAFWLYNGYKNAELDIFEFWNEDNIWGNYDPSLLSTVVNTNFHYQYTDGEDTTQMCPLKVDQGIDYSADFHIFTFEWDPFKAKWYIDGELVREKYLYYTLNGQNIDCNSIEPFQAYARLTNYPLVENFTVLFNTAVQVSGGPPDDDTPFPSSFEIDYFRYWKKDDCSGDLYANTVEDLELNPDRYNIKIKENIHLGSGVILAANQQVDLKASNSILIEPGAQLFGAYDAWIAPCNQYKLMSEENHKPHSRPYSENQELFLSDGVIQPVDIVSLKIDPNPFYTSIQIESKMNDQYYFTILNSSGIVIQKSSVINDGIYDIDLSAIPSGVYFIRFNYLNSSNSIVRKIVKI